MNKKVLATAMVVLGLFPSLLFGQLYRMDVDVQDAGAQKVIDRVFTGNTVGLDVGFYDGGDPLIVTNWTMLFRYYDSQYSTNPAAQIAGVASSNRVAFDSTTNLFYSANENYYFSISGVDELGRKRTFARGRMIEEYDPATAGSGGVSSNGVYFISWGNVYGDPAGNSNLVSFIEEYAGADSIAREIATWASNAAAWSSNNFENVWARGDSVTNAVDSVARAGVASNADSIAAVGAVASNALPAGATNGLLDLAGTRAMTGESVTLARDVKSRDATSAACSGAAFGTETIANAYGFAAGGQTKAGNFGAAFGYLTASGYGGFSAGLNALGTNGAFVFADYEEDDIFDRTSFPNTFSLRVKGGIYAEIGTNIFAVSNTVTMNGVDLGTSGGGISASDATNIAQAVVAEATTNDMPGIDWSSLGGGGASPAPSKSIGASAVGWSILNTNNAPFVTITTDTNMGAMLNFPLDTANAVDSMPIVSDTSASITQLVFVARAYAAGGSEWGTVGLKTTFGGSILTNVVTLTNAPTTQTVTLAHAPVSGPCVVPFSWGILATSTVGTAVGNVRLNVMQARGSW